MIQITRHPCHLYVLGRRVHHFWTGVAIAAVGIAVALSDLHDRHVWVADLRVKRISL